MQNVETLTDLLWLTRPLAQEIEKTIERGLEGTGITVRMRVLLDLLARDGSLSVPDLASELGLKRQSVQVMINDTHAAGLTEKRENPRHKRSSLIVLTAAGADTITEIRAREAELFEEIGARLHAQDIDTALSIGLHLFGAFRRENNGAKTEPVS